MSEVMFSMELKAGVDADLVAEQLRARLSQLETVADVDAQPNSERTGLESVTVFVTSVVGLITLVGTATSGLTTIVANLRKLVTEIKGLMSDLGITKAEIEVAGKKVAVDDLTDADLETLAAKTQSNQG